MKTNKMQLKFEGQSHTIDANTLINVLTHYQTVITEANRIYGGGVNNVKLEINAIEKGSFIIDVSLAQTIRDLFSKDTASYIASLVTIVGGVYGAYKILKGKPAKSEKEKAEIINVAGDVTTKNIKNVAGDVIIQNITNIYNQPVVREAISKSIETSDEDGSVDGFSIYTEKDSQPVAFERKDFKDYIYNDFENEGDIPDDKIIEDDATLVIVALNFEKGSRWQFMYNGFKIQMQVKDDALMKKIDEGERFGKGDSIKVKLRIVQRYNKQYRAYENKTYKIAEFYSHIIPEKSRDMFE